MLKEAKTGKWYGRILSKVLPEFTWISYKKYYRYWLDVILCVYGFFLGFYQTKFLQTILFLLILVTVAILLLNRLKANFPKEVLLYIKDDYIY